MGFTRINFNSDEICSSYLCGRKKIMSMGDSSGNIKILNLKEGFGLYKILKIHDLGVTKISTVDSKLLSCSLDSKLKIWDLSKWCLINSFFEHQGSINDLDVSEKTIITASEDGDLRIWDIRIKSSTGKISHGSNLTNCSFLNDKNLILSHGLTNFVYLWDLRMNQNILAKSKILKKSNYSILSSCVSKFSNFIFILDSQNKVYRLTGRDKKISSPCNFFSENNIRKEALHKSILKLNLDDRGNFILNGDSQGKSYIRSQKNGKILSQFKDHFAPVKEVIINSVLKIFFSYSIDGSFVFRTF